MELALNVWQLQGITNMLFLIYWDFTSVDVRLRQHLLSTSTGIGVLRRKKLLNRVHVRFILNTTIILVIECQTKCDKHCKWKAFVQFFV